MKKILQKQARVLRQTAKEVLIEKIKTAKIKKILKEMSSALKSQDDGVAIAAPQIGYALRIFVVSGKIFAKDFGKKRPARNAFSIADARPHDSLQRIGQAGGEKKINSEEEILLNENNIVEKIETKEKIKDLIFINSKISKLSREKEWMPEGCLSVRWFYGKTLRSKKATITAYDENGKKFTRGASGLLAQIFQHETEHLNGILFIDHAKDIKEELPARNASHSDAGGPK